MKDPHTSAQKMVLVLLPKFTGAIGLACSLFLACELIRDILNREGNAIKRALLAVCVFEMCASFGWFLSTWAVWYSEGAFPFSTGTKGSCNFQGFLLQSSIGGPLNVLQMTYYFYLVVVKERSVKKLGIKEWRYHFAFDAFPVLTAFTLLFLGHYNPMENVCDVNGYPVGCDESVFDGNGTGECIRGSHSHITGLVLFSVPLWICMILVSYINWLMRGHLLANNSTDASWITSQALLYSLAFLVTWTPSTIWSIMTYANEGVFWIDMLTAFFEPFQGFWNLMIFLRNRPDSLERLKLLLSCKACTSDEEVEDDDNCQPKCIETMETAIVDADVQVAASVSTHQTQSESK
jgi:hypothetical protein